MTHIIVIYTDILNYTFRCPSLAMGKEYIDWTMLIAMSASGIIMILILYLIICVGCTIYGRANQRPNPAPTFDTNMKMSNRRRTI